MRVGEGSGAGLLLGRAALWGSGNGWSWGESGELPLGQFSGSARGAWAEPRVPLRGERETGWGGRLCCEVELGPRGGY